jgi:hypothetical protein
MPYYKHPILMEIELLVTRKGQCSPLIKMGTFRVSNLAPEA